MAEGETCRWDWMNIQNISNWVRRWSLQSRVRKADDLADVGAVCPGHNPLYYHGSSGTGCLHATGRSAPEAQHVPESPLMVPDRMDHERNGDTASGSGLWGTLADRI